MNVNGAIALEFLNCQYNQLTSLDVSQNTALTTLYCDHNPLTTSLTVNGAISLNLIVCDNTQLTSLDVSGATALRSLYCDSNQLESLNVTGASALKWLYCQYNQLTSLDVSQNTILERLYCNSNQLTSLNMKNGNNVNMGFNAKTNPNLFCIDVDDVVYATTNWSTYIDPQSYFSENCSVLGIDDEVLAGFAMYPNPTFDIVRVSINDEASYSIVNLNGQVLKNGKLIAGDNTLRTSQLSNGLYFLNIRTNRGFIFKKLVKQ